MSSNSQKFLKDCQKSIKDLQIIQSIFMLILINIKCIIKKTSQIEKAYINYNILPKLRKQNG